MPSDSSNTRQCSMEEFPYLFAYTSIFHRSHVGTFLFYFQYAVIAFAVGLVLVLLTALFFQGEVSSLLSIQCQNDNILCYLIIFNSAIACSVCPILFHVLLFNRILVYSVFLSYNISSYIDRSEPIFFSLISMDLTISYIILFVLSYFILHYLSSFSSF